mmetsp:Transcript_32223/g.79075  ORF Transcript_32223/g.79075 Transcript_32223/m.79075 type:complete len:338 (-) Transcript_32223:663-1676(-)
MLFWMRLSDSRRASDCSSESALPVSMWSSSFSTHTKTTFSSASASSFMLLTVYTRSTNSSSRTPSITFRSSASCRNTSRRVCFRNSVAWSPASISELTPPAWRPWRRRSCSISWRSFFSRSLASFIVVLTTAASDCFSTSTRWFLAHSATVRSSVFSELSSLMCSRCRCPSASRSSLARCSTAISTFCSSHSLLSARTMSVRRSISALWSACPERRSLRSFSRATTSCLSALISSSAFFAWSIRARIGVSDLTLERKKPAPLYACVTSSVAARSSCSWMKPSLIFSIRRPSCEISPSRIVRSSSTCTLVFESSTPSAAPRRKSSSALSLSLLTPCPC